MLINGTEQWVLVRGQKASNPLIIHVQAGPGLPMIPEAATMERLLHLEQDYLVAYWDQRGCGKSFRSDIDPGTINLGQLAEDVISCTKFLLDKYDQQKAILIGYSIGATVSLMAALKKSHLFDRVFLVGIDIDLPQANAYASDFLVKKARMSGKSKWIKQAAKLSSTPIEDTKTFQARAKLLTNLGGINTKVNYNRLLINTIKNMVGSSAYKLSDIPKTIKGMEFCQNAILPEMNKLSLFKRIGEVKVPVHFIQGKKDGVAPIHTAVDYYEYLKAPVKTFTSFDESAHMPHYEEPDKFSALIRRYCSPLSAKE